MFEPDVIRRHNAIAAWSAAILALCVVAFALWLQRWEHAVLWFIGSAYAAHLALKE